MSDISIPGLQNPNSSIDTEKLINDLIEVERIPLNRLEERISTDELRREAWSDLGRRINELNEDANFLYSFQNPFNERVGSSSNENALQLLATREADEEEYEIEILSLAGRDRFSSPPIANDYRLAAGRYRFTVGSDEVLLDYSGGELKDFARRLSAQGEGLLGVRVVPHSAEESVIVFESLKSGADQALAFHDEALTFALEQGVVEYRPEIAFEFTELRTLGAGTEEQLDLGNTINSATEELVLQYESRFLPDKLFEAQEPLRSGSATLEGVTVQNLLSANLLEEAPAPPPRVDDLTLLFAVAGNGKVALPDITDSTEFTATEIELQQHVPALRALLLQNSNSHRAVQFRNIRIANRDGGSYHPLNPIEERSNAHLKLDGVEVQRDSNSIDDLIPGVTLELLSESQQPITMEITPDYEAVKEALISFVGNYNQLIRDVNIFTRTDTRLIEEIEYFTGEERTRASERLGIFSAETTLDQLRQRLITITQNPYPTSAEREIALLAQVGIATNAVGANIGAVNPSRLRGYLEVDESQLDSQLATHFQAIKELFGSDQDGDFVVDSGVAFEIENYTDLYIRAGGVIQSRNAGLDSRIERTGQQAETYNRRLERYEQQLRDDFGRMQGALNALEDSTQSLDSLNNNNN